jgi:Zn-dependent protease
MPPAETNPGTFRVAGIPVDVPISGLIGVILLAYLWAPSFDGNGSTSRWVLAGSFAVLLSLATLIHEFAHALAARAFGLRVHRVVLQLMGGVTYYQRSASPAPMREAVIAASGPLATFAVAGLSWGVAAVTPAGSTAWLLARALLWANLVMGIYNSLPGAPLDGGTVLRAIVWGATGSERTGTLVSARAGQVVAVATFALPFLATWAWGGDPDPIIYILGGLLAAMLWAGATAQLRGTEIRERAQGLSAAGLARRAIPVDRDVPLGEALRRCSAAGAAAFVVVDPTGMPLALGQSAAIAAVPEQRRPWVSAAAVSRSIDSDSALPMDLAGPGLVATVAGRGLSEYLVVDPGGLIYGVLVAADVELALRGSR